MRLLEVARHVGDEARAMPAREAARRLADAFDDNDVLTFANAIAFRLLFATFPVLLFGVGALGALGLEETWSADAAPKLREQVSPNAFIVMDDTVRRVLEEAQVFWMTAGLVIAVYAMSGGMRAIMDVFDRIYCAERRRPRGRRVLVSVVLAVVVGSLVLLSVAVVQVAPRLAGDGAAGHVAGVLRWPVAVVVLSTTVAVLVRWGPSEKHPGTYVTFGSLVVVGAWLLTSLAFGWYLKSVADYGSVYGALATAIVAMQYVYLAALAFLTGAQLDALVRHRLEGDETGHSHRGEGGAKRPAFTTAP